MHAMADMVECSHLVYYSMVVQLSKFNVYQWPTYNSQIVVKEVTFNLETETFTVEISSIEIVTC